MKSSSVTSPGVVGERLVKFIFRVVGGSSVGTLMRVKDEVYHVFVKLLPRWRHCAHTIHPI